MQKQIIYADATDNFDGLGDLYNDTLYIPVNREYEHDEVIIDLIVS